MEIEEKNYKRSKQTMKQKCRERFIKLSNADNFDDACKEWAWHGKLRRKRDQEDNCQLCGKQHLNTLYEINHEDDHQKKIDVASTCILRFNLDGYYDIKLLTQEERAELNLDISDNDGEIKLTKEQLKEILQKTQMRLMKQECIRSLKDISYAESDQELTQAIIYYLDNGQKNLTPLHAKAILKTLAQYQISSRNGFYHIQLQSLQDWSQVKAMKPFQLDYIWKIMTEAQRKYLLKKRVQFPHSLSQHIWTLMNS